MIQILSTQYAQKNTPQDIFNVLEGLSGVKRLDMLVMFLSKKQEQGKCLFIVIHSNITDFRSQGFV